MRRWMRIAGRTIAVLGMISSSPTRAQDVVGSSVSLTMPFELVSGFLVVVNGQIGNLGVMRFILDTGATSSVIDAKVADRLRLPRSSGKVMSFDRRIPVEWTEIPEFRVGPIVANALRVMVIDLARYSRYGKDVDGVVGLDLLARSEQLSIDYDRRILLFQLANGRRDERTPVLGFKIPIVIQGAPVQFLVDTGFRGILLYRDRVRNQLPRMRTEGEPKQVVESGMRTTEVRLPGMRIGGSDQVRIVFLIDGPGRGDLPGVDGILGAASLHAKRIDFDFTHMVLRCQ
jgi:predicted aspartyl protease